MNDVWLIRRSKRGDREAFGVLIDKYRAPVYRLVRGILADPTESEDVTQEIFLKAFANLAKFRGESGFFTWLYRIAVNESLRTRKRRRLVTTDALPEAEAPPLEEPAEKGPNLATLQRMLGKLPGEFRTIVVLRDLEGLSYKAIADTLEVPIGTVESRLFRARRELREMWRTMKETQNVL